ncbi:amino acid/amide ABC transporter membrane protein 1 and 2 [Frankia torreyi]|uniref:Amino acid/amide ABC transporter membrane protein 1 and 2 n=1 Tax=Frankia torreyi TaxID=1856 RepID=A0A0D8BIC5_9ACTN|nr:MULTISPECIES: ABC transporter permease [Frankia]KJE24013.1 amino acid/amide ABC transporter membrane protein 1 and 2 [Frankia torreyi]KQC38726.1 ABC transporter permease [Frankia sp. ACN1ag]
MTSIDLALAGISLGAIAALSGIGLLVTYRTNGVLNLAQGGIATLVAYIFREMVVEWDLPIWLAAVIALAVVSPGIGLLLERLVFRPLARRRASAAEALVASLGVLVLSLGITAGIWGLGSRSDAPSIFPNSSVRVFGDSRLGVDALAELIMVVVFAAVIGIIAARTAFGRQIRAVVDDRQLAELSGVPADKVAAAGWAAGTTMAGLTGILLAPRFQLTPYGLTLLVLETFAVVVAARLSSMPVAVLTALGIAILQSELKQFTLHGDAGQILTVLQSNLFIVALLVLLLAVPKLRELGSGDSGATASFSSRGAPPSGRVSGVRLRRDYLGKLGGGALLLAPLTFAPSDLRSAFMVPALALIFLSMVIVTGYSGQLSLGAAGFAGLGALLSLKLANGDLFGLPAIPGIASMFVGALFVAPIGLITGYPAIRRRGLTLALTTFAVGAVVSRFVFEQPTFATGLYLDPLSLFGWELSEKAFYVFELLCLGFGLLVVRNLHHGRLGRALLALRDHSEGAAAVGVDVRNLKLLAFTVSSVVAGLGGTLLVHSSYSFSADDFAPLQSLLWFTAVVVFGADSAAGAIVAAAFMVTIDVLAPAGSSTLAIGILALALGWMPGGLASAVRGLLRLLAQYLADSFVDPNQRAPRPVPVRISAVGHLPATTGITGSTGIPGIGSTLGAARAGHYARWPLSGNQLGLPADAPRLTPFGASLVAMVQQYAAAQTAVGRQQRAAGAGGAPRPAGPQPSRAGAGAGAGAATHPAEGGRA